MSINLTTIDEFLPKEEFNKIYNNIPFLEWTSSGNYIEGIDHIWYSNGPLSSADFSIFETALGKKFNKKTGGFTGVCGGLLA